MVKRTASYSKGSKSMSGKVAKYKEGGGVGGIGGGSGVDGSGNRGRGGFGGGTSGNQGGGGMGGGGKGGVSGTGVRSGMTSGTTMKNSNMPNMSSMARPRPMSASPPKPAMAPKPKIMAPKPVGMAPKPKSKYSGYGNTSFSPKDDYGTRQALGAYQASNNKGSANQAGKGDLGAGIGGFTKTASRMAKGGSVPGKKK